MSRTMDLVGGSTPSVDKQRLTLRPADRQEAILDHLRRTPGVRDVVVSGGDVANVPWPRLESFLLRLLEIDSVRDIRLASKALVGLPQHWLQPQVVSGLENVAGVAARRGVHLAVHTHANHVQSVTPLVAEGARALLDAGVRDVRNQGVLMRGVNDSTACSTCASPCRTRRAPTRLLHVRHGARGGALADITRRGPGPPARDHGLSARLRHSAHRLRRAVRRQKVVPQAVEYDRERGISYWTKNYRTAIELDDPDALTRRYPFHDPLSTLPESGWRWWERQVAAREGQHAPDPPAG
ncbi:lysine 2,3-aminomutase [Streptomyces californicus]